MSIVSDYSDGVPHISYCLITFDGEVIAESGADTPVYAASTIKLAVLIAALRAVDAGKLRLSQQLSSRLTFRSSAPGGGTFSFEQDPDETDDGMPPAGRPVSLREVLRRMIVVSSNEATNMAVELVGLDAVRGALAVCGASSSKMERLFGDLEGLAAGLTQQTTARDLTAIMSAIVTGRAAGRSSTRFMVELLRAQEYSLIGPALPAEARWGSKSGWVTGIRHDVAFVQPYGGTDPMGGFILAVCTRAYGEAEATTAIGALSRLAWDLSRTRPGGLHYVLEGPVEEWATG
ncbi:serine hydrolase [Arthrobacter sp. MSA 4-2]|uniref:serine hydrolase n=1 Tax=Arthrobacter sp. MSA 4-2 TaxID=2794349 RepID=UPI0018E8116E|nr:serine hydrolase [Arthrobacter sp. MSA 4-2]MBJ2119471.1 serine hydrolase [Arthrobacter sp. MSA 4-2]